MLSFFPILNCYSWTVSRIVDRLQVKVASPAGQIRPLFCWHLDAGREQQGSTRAACLSAQRRTRLLLALAVQALAWRIMHRIGQMPLPSQACSNLWQVQRPSWWTLK